VKSPESKIPLDTMFGGQRVYLEKEVDRPARIIAGRDFPRYPVNLKSAGTEGRVVLLHVVDTTGTIEMRSVQIVEVSHMDFLTSVRTTLPTLRFVPATRGGRPVRVWAQQAFEFRLGE
jgi:TonB family protein